MRVILSIHRNTMHARDMWANAKKLLEECNEPFTASFPGLVIEALGEKTFYRSAHSCTPSFYIGMEFDEIHGDVYIDDEENRIRLMSRRKVSKD